MLWKKKFSESSDEKKKNIKFHVGTLLVNAREKFYFSLNTSSSLFCSPLHDTVHSDEEEEENFKK